MKCLHRWELSLLLDLSTFMGLIIRAKGDMQVRIMGGPKIAPLYSSLATHAGLSGWMMSLLTKLHLGMKEDYYDIFLLMVCLTFKIQKLRKEI